MSTQNSVNLIAGNNVTLTPSASGLTLASTSTALTWSKSIGLVTTFTMNPNTGVLIGYPAGPGVVITLNGSADGDTFTIIGAHGYVNGFTVAGNTGQTIYAPSGVSGTTLSCNQSPVGAVTLVYINSVFYIVSLTGWASLA